MALTNPLYCVADNASSVKESNHMHSISAVSTGAAASLAVDRTIILNKRMARSVFQALETAFIGSFPDP